MSNTIDTRVFKLTNFSPIGFKLMNYPVTNCSVCRGLLHDVCHTCEDLDREICPVTNQNELYYHTHCYTFITESIQPAQKNTNKKMAAQLVQPTSAELDDEDDDEEM